MNLVTVKESCELCGGDVVGNRNIKYLCRRCNVLYDFNMIGLFIGRFQPFHNGHLKVIKEALKEMKALQIVVAIPLRQTDKDPFSAEDRISMIKTALKDEGIKKYDIVAVRDIPSDAEYVHHVREHTRIFNTVFVGDNKLNEKLFKEAGFKVVTSPRFFNLDATHIRELMKKGQEWKDLVPKAVAEHIEKKGLASRV
ncbi:MAG: nicotinamide-nucleotide adenylyltransferase [Nanoarchaeota archaeon]|nr:nicotinamide-nucleotide adenylyltransferase [Nanoarchaeota archaeon]